MAARCSWLCKALDCSADVAKKLILVLGSSLMGAVNRFLAECVVQRFFCVEDLFFLQFYSAFPKSLDPFLGVISGGQSVLEQLDTRCWQRADAAGRRQAVTELNGPLKDEGPLGMAALPTLGSHLKRARNSSLYQIPLNFTREIPCFASSA